MFETPDNVADFIAAIAILITVTHLAIRIRDTTPNERASTIQSPVDSVVTVSQFIYRDAEVGELFDRGWETRGACSRGASERLPTPRRK